MNIKCSREGDLTSIKAATPQQRDDSCPVADLARRAPDPAGPSAGGARRYRRGAIQPPEENMPKIALLYFKVAVLFLLITVVIGLQMSITGVFGVRGAHTHVGLLGWVTAFSFGTYFALNPDKADSKLATVQFWLFVPSTAALSGSLYLLLQGVAAMGPVVLVSSLLMSGAIALFAFIVFANAPAPGPVGRAAETA
jgi:hypothetical protein